MWHKENNMNNLPQSVEVHLGRQGRLVIPAALRQSLGFEEGDTLVAREEAGRLVLEKQEMVKQRLKARFAQVPKNRSLVDELIAERREAAKQEVVE
jgi:AbrB family looped-hinge helix DNA binding protein